MTSKDPSLGTVVFCDGACSGNPGPGGWAAIIATPDGRVVEIGAGESQTTNNQMELTAAIEGLGCALSGPSQVSIYTDSVYVIRGITQWIWAWKRNDWRTSDGKDVQNRPHWEKLSAMVGRLKAAGKTIDWKYVRGHSGNPGNERCDEIAVAFSKGATVSLYRGSLLGYGVSIYDLPEEIGLPEMSSNRSEKKAAYSYLSVIGGIPARHSTWEECERRVKGQPGAKFKKAVSVDDEKAILKSWGVDPKNLK